MAHICIDRILARFGDLNIIYRRLEPERIAGQIIAQVEPRLEEYIDEIMYELQPVLWDNLPSTLRRRIYRWAQRNFPARVQELVDDFNDDFSELVDLKALLDREMEHHPDLMNRIFKEAGAQEIRFVIASGGVIGALLGAALLPFIDHLAYRWLLPAIGFGVGFVTNWLALNLIFRPLNPRYIFGIRLQGLFLRRQSQISAVWSRLVAEELITVEKVAYSMLHGSQAARTRAIIQRHLRPMIDQSTVMKVMAQMTVGMAGYTELRSAMNDKAVNRVRPCVPGSRFQSGPRPDCRRGHQRADAGPEPGRIPGHTQAGLSGRRVAAHVCRRHSGRARGRPPMAVLGVVLTTVGGGA